MSDTFLHFLYVTIMFQPLRTIFKLFYGRYEEAEWNDLVEKLHKKMDLAEEMVAGRGTKFLSSNDRPYMVDYNAWPFFERVEALAAIYPEKASFLPEERFPKLVSILNNVKAFYVTCFNSRTRG